MCDLVWVRGERAVNGGKVCPEMSPCATWQISRTAVAVWEFWPTSTLILAELGVSIQLGESHIQQKTTVALEKITTCLQKDLTRGSWSEALDLGSSRRSWRPQSFKLAVNSVSLCTVYTLYIILSYTSYLYRTLTWVCVDVVTWQCNGEMRCYTIIRHGITTFVRTISSTDPLSRWVIYMQSLQSHSGGY